MVGGRDDGILLCVVVEGRWGGGAGVMQALLHVCTCAVAIACERRKR